MRYNEFKFDGKIYKFINCKLEQNDGSFYVSFIRNGENKESYILDATNMEPKLVQHKKTRKKLKRVSYHASGCVIYHDTKLNSNYFEPISNITQLNPFSIWSIPAINRLEETSEVNKEDYIIVIWHPVTLGDDNLFELILGIKELKGWSGYTYFFRPNADTGSYIIDSAFKELDLKTYVSLPRNEYIKLLSKAKCIIGNSSSGIIEAPCLGTPTINIGWRQFGRLKAKSIINCYCAKHSIGLAFDILESNHFKQTMESGYELFYKGGNVVEKILKIIERELPKVNMKKRFYDLP